MFVDLIRVPPAGRRPGRDHGRKAKDANGGRVLDFHSFCHSYVSSLDRTRISEGLSWELARASWRVILERYTRRKLAALSAAVELIPVIRLDASAPPALAPEETVGKAYGQAYETADGGGRRAWPSVVAAQQGRTGPVFETGGCQPIKFNSPPRRPCNQAEDLSNPVSGQSFCSW